MDAVHAVPVDDTAVALVEPVGEPAARNGTVHQMFRYSRFLDVGEGAEECEHARDGACEDVEHFHAWLRVPTPYQHADIRDKGLAAKARRLRQLADIESDERVVLDQALAGMNDPLYVDALVEELMRSNQVTEFMDAQRDVDEREEFAHINQDREEYARQARTQEALPEDQRSAAYTRLSAHIDSYYEALNKHMAAARAPRRGELQAREPGDLVDLVRAHRMEAEGDRAFNDEYSAWIWFVGTYRVDIHATCKRPYRLMWDEMGARDRPAVGTMFAEPPEVLDAVQTAFVDLRLALSQGSAGN